MDTNETTSPTPDAATTAPKKGWFSQLSDSVFGMITGKKPFQADANVDISQSTKNFITGIVIFAGALVLFIVFRPRK